MKPSNRTKIVATLGPASRDEDTMVQLVRAGANVFRLNCAHADHKTLIKTIKTVRKVARQENSALGVLADLQGPKIRVGPLRDAEPIYLQSGQPLTISTDPNVIGEAAKEGEVTRIGSGYKGLSKDVKPGEAVLLDDGNIELRVEKVTGSEVHTEVVHGGLLKQFKGINLPGSQVSAATLTKKDLEDLKVVLANAVDFVALSFVRNAGDLRLLAKHIKSAKGRVRMIAKIERPEAIDNLESIIEESYGIMVARGDMGVELGPETVPALQKRIISLSLQASRPVITATQMLESMITNPRPTRAEASDVANAIYDGSSAVMLSAETASGKYPVRSVEIMESIARRTEQDIESTSDYFPGRRARSPRGEYSSVPLATVRAAAYGALEAGAKLIAVFTESGTTARHMAGERVAIPIVAFSPHPETLQRLALSWGIQARKVKKTRTTQEMNLEGERILVEEGWARPGDRIVAVFGHSVREGVTNTMTVRTIGQISD